MAGETARMRTKRLPTTPEPSSGEPESAATTAPKETADASSVVELTAPVDSTAHQSPNPSRTATEHGSFIDEPIESPRPSTSWGSIGAVQSLEKLRHAFLTAELALYKQLAESHTDHLNEVRRQFRSSATLAKRRLKAWTDREAPNAKGQEGLGDFDSSLLDPEWFDRASYLPPSSRVVVRDKDWGSIIAFTLR